jgi:membrane protein implicated in regulation of membrane protease activity
MQPWHLWTVLGIALYIVEMLSFSFFPASFALAAAQLGLTTAGQLGVFAVASVLCLALVRPLARGLYRASDHRPVLTDALLGTTGTVVDPITSGTPGRVRVGGEEWRAITESLHPLPEGTLVEILRVEGATLTVRCA